jgi:hypothetical protein
MVVSNMHTIIQYLFESSICLIVLYAFYYFFLRKETFFQLNRIYLLSSPFLALTIPIINIDLSALEAPAQYPILYPLVANANAAQTQFWTQMNEPTPAFQLTLADFLFGLYLVGALFMAVRLIIGLYRLFRIIRRSQRAQLDRYTLVETDPSIPAASFFSYIFWNQNTITDEKRIILEHEMVHVRQRHSIDVLLMEFWVILKWFNPLIYWFRNSLRETHEYIADHYMSRQMGSAYRYASFLATQVHLSDSCHPLANNFAAMIRKRLKMLARGQSSQWRTAKYFTAFPLIATLLLLFSFNLVNQLPDQVKQPFQKAENYIGVITATPILEFDEDIEETAQALVWGETFLPIANVTEMGDLSLDVNHVSFPLFEQWAQQSLHLVGTDKRVPFDRVVVQGFSHTGERLSLELSSDDTWRLAEKAKVLGREFTLYMRFEGAKEPYYAIVNITSDPTYVEYPDVIFNFITSGDLSTFCLHTDDRILGPTHAEEPKGPYLAIGAQRIPLVEIGKNEKFEIPRVEIAGHHLRALLEMKPSVWLENKTYEVKRIALTAKAGSKEQNCDMDAGSRIDCLEEAIQMAETNAESLTLLLRTEKQKAFIGRIVWPRGGEIPPASLPISNYLQEKFSIFTQKTVINPRLPRPAFHETSLLMEWGDIMVPIPKRATSNAYQGAITLSLPEFEAILYNDISVTYENTPISVSSIFPSTARTEDMSDHFSFYRWYMKETGVFPDNPYPVLDEKFVSLIREKIHEGYSVFTFVVGMSDQVNPTKKFPDLGSLNQTSPTSNFSFTIKVYREGAQSNNKGLQEGILIDPGVDRFQLINRPGEPTIIKIDTTNQKYKWMHDMYKNKPEVQVVHIPGYHTINRVLTLDDRLLPEGALQRTETLVRKPQNVDHLPEYYDFKDKPILLSWGQLAGVDDQTVYSLKTFKKESKNKLQLNVGNEQLELQQFELLFVPEKGDAIRFITDRTNHSKVQKVIRQMGPRTSVLVTRIIAASPTGETLHFPITFAFHLN